MRSSASRAWLEVSTSALILHSCLFYFLAYKPQDRTAASVCRSTLPIHTSDLDLLWHRFLADIRRMRVRACVRETDPDGGPAGRTRGKPFAQGAAASFSRMHLSSSSGAPAAAPLLW